MKKYILLSLYLIAKSVSAEIKSNYTDIVQGNAPNVRDLALEINGSVIRNDTVVSIGDNLSMTYVFDDLDRDNELNSEFIFFKKSSSPREVLYEGTDSSYVVKANDYGAPIVACIVPKTDIKKTFPSKGQEKCSDVTVELPSKVTLTPLKSYLYTDITKQVKAFATFQSGEKDITRDVGTSWISQDSTVAQIENSSNEKGKLIGVKTGDTTGVVKYSGYSVEFPIKVFSPYTSPHYGSILTEDLSSKYRVDKNNEELFEFRCGEIVDAIGTKSEGLHGGKGGTPFSTSSENIRKITVVTGLYNVQPLFDELGVAIRVSILQLVLVYEDGSSFTCGTMNSAHAQPSNTYDFIIPNDYILSGLKVNSDDPNVSPKQYIRGLILYAEPKVMTD